VLVQFDREQQGRVTIEQVAELLNGRTFAGTRIENTERTTVFGRPQEPGSMSNGFRRSGIEAATHLSCEPHKRWSPEKRYAAPHTSTERHETSLRNGYAATFD
jgi:hypothetical protein